MLLNRGEVLRTDASVIGGFRYYRYSKHAAVYVHDAVAPPQSVQRYIGQ